MYVYTMKYNVIATLIRDYAGIRLFEKLYQVQASESRYFREDSPCLFFDRPFYVFV